jgi:hypothetical protein
VFIRDEICFLVQSKRKPAIPGSLGIIAGWLGFSRTCALDHLEIFEAGAEPQTSNPTRNATVSCDKVPLLSSVKRGEKFLPPNPE